ncbi:hypothetical protein CgunFtcFv8_016096 [Champsocephalus gunnari]|uniref:Uncharacterized protein n=1 Tax=Champsocephalus gunnari TaxID=52237 RepID=A0AAN8HA33_CHAGU|nr:hypothetical protein CgunFtcFv8_016096 [Champsocephalus gunnari]
MLPQYKRETLISTDLQNKTAAAPPKLSSLSSLEEGQLLKGLRERMGQLSVQETSEEGRGRHHTREEDNVEKERRRKERKASAEGGGEEQTLRTPLMEPGPAPCPPQLRPAEEREHPPLSSRTADCQVCAGEAGRGGGGGAGSELCYPLAQGHPAGRMSDPCSPFTIHQMLFG